MKLEKSTLLLRTNPLLSGNVKLTMSSDNGLYMTTFDTVNQSLKSVINKKVNYSSDFSRDIYSHYGSIPNELLYQVKNQMDDSLVYSYPDQQFETEYQFGASKLVSNLYDEQFRILAPMLLSNTLPEFFCIFKVDGAKSFEYTRNPEKLVVGNNYKVFGDDNADLILHNSIKYKNGDEFIAISEDYAILDTSAYCIIKDFNAETSFDYFQDFVKPSNILKIIPLKNSKFGDYIQKSLLSQPLFSQSPISVDYDGKTITYTGVSVLNGCIISVTESMESLMKDEIPIKEFDKYVTEGFKRNNLLLSNLLNIEYLFDDVISDDFTNNRYFGLYLNSVPFSLVDNISDINDDVLHKTSNNLSLEKSKGFFYAKEPNGSITKAQGNNLLENDLLFNYNQLNVKKCEKRGFQLTEILLTESGKIPVGAHISAYVNEKYIGKVVADDLKNLEKGDFGYEEINERGYLLNYFNPNTSSTKELIQRISNSLLYLFGENNITSVSTCFYNNNLIFYSTSYNNFKIRLHVENADGTIKIENETLRGYSRNNKSRIKILLQDVKEFSGDKYLKTNIGFSKIKDIVPFIDDIETNEIGGIKDPNSLENYFAVTISDDSEISFINNSNNVVLYEKRQIEFGMFDICPVCDIDFDFYEKSTNSLTNEYKKYYKLESGQLMAGEKYYLFQSKIDQSSLFSEIKNGENIYQSGENYTAFEFIASSEHFEVLQGDAIVIRKIYYHDNELKNFIGFNKIGFNSESAVQYEDIYDMFMKNDFNEYEVLNENSMSKYSLESKTLPYITKWVMKGNDIRNNEYRLNMSRSFGKYSFTPSFYSNLPDPKEFTNEWFYLSCYPDSMSKEDTYNSTSYFDKVFDVSKHKSVIEDYFVYYFTVNKRNIINDDIVTVYPVKYQERYSIIKQKYIGNQTKIENKYETFFRGVKMQLQSDTANLDGYKFSCILNVRHSKLEQNKSDNFFDIQFSQNDAFKNIVMVVDCYIEDYKSIVGDKVLDNNQAVDYVYLYTMKHLRSKVGDDLVYGREWDVPDSMFQNIYIGNNLFEQDVTKLKKFNGSKIYGSKLNLTYRLKYNLGKLDLQFDDDFYQFKKLYHNNIKGNINNIIGFNGRHVVFTNPISYNGISRNIITNLLEGTSIKNVTDRGYKLEDVKNETVGNINVGSGGITLASHVNSVFVTSFDVDGINKIVNLSNFDWLEHNGGYNYYEYLVNGLMLSSIKNIVNGKDSKLASFVRTYTDGKNDSFYLNDDSINLTKISFLQPSTISFNTTISSKKTDKLLDEYPNEIMSDWDIVRKNKKDEIFRVGGDFYPKLNDIFVFNKSNNNFNSQWKDNTNFYNKNNNQYNEEYNDKDDIIKIDDIADVNYKKTKYLLRYLQNYNFTISSNAIIKNHYFHKISEYPQSKIITANNPIYENNAEICIDKGDVNVFKSPFDLDKFKLYRSKKVYDPINQNMIFKDIKSYFGSNVTKTPLSFDICSFDIRFDDQVANITSDILATFQEKYSYTIRKNFVEKYVNESYIYNNNLDIFIDNFCKENVLFAYKPKSVRLFVRNNAHENVYIKEDDQNDLSLLKMGFSEERNFEYNISDYKLSILYRSHFDVSKLQYSIIVQYELI